MASLNGIKLKNVKSYRYQYRGRIDMEHNPIGYFSFTYEDGYLSDLFVDINFFTKKAIRELNADNLFLSDDSLTDAIGKDDLNREEFNKRVDMFCEVPDKKYEDTFCFPDIHDFVKKLLLLYLAEKEKCKGMKKKTRSKKFDIWMGEAE